MDREVLARFSRDASAGKAKAEADKLQARRRAGRIRSVHWKENSLVPTLDDLKPTAPSDRAGPGAGARRAGRQAMSDREYPRGPSSASAWW